MFRRKSLLIYLATFALMSFAGSALAQYVPDPYKAGWDAAYKAGGSGQFLTAQEAYDALGFSKYGPAFADGFLLSIAFYDGQMMYGNPYAGAFVEFKIWYDITLLRKKAIVIQRATVKRTVKRTTRNFRSLSRASRLRTAGDLFQEVSLSFDYSYASVEDKILNGDGNDSEVALFLGGKIGEKLNFGFGFAKDRYSITGNDRGYEQKTGTIDLLLSYNIGDSLSIGVFVSNSFVDIEDEQFRNAFIKGDSYERWGAGLLVSYNKDFGDSTNLGLTASIASMNKRSLERVLDDEDTAGVFLIDLNHRFSDNLDVTIYGSYFGLLDRETSPEDPDDIVPDGSYWTWGADLNIGLTKNSMLSLGYETTASDNDYEEDRVNLSLVVDF